MSCDFKEVSKFYWKAVLKKRGRYSRYESWLRNGHISSWILTHDPHMLGQFWKFMEPVGGRILLKKCVTGDDFEDL